METPQNNSEELHLELQRQLEVQPSSSQPADPWRVEQVLKESPSEVTQLVYLRTAAGGELGPYVRKRIDLRSGLGEVWQRLWLCQSRGLRSRQLPRLISCEAQDGSLDVVMERVVGPTMRERVLKTSSQDRLALAERLLPALCSAAIELNESLGEVVVHRDITPSNVICSGQDGEVPVLLDLGIARVWSRGQEADTTHFGTRAYAPPEQFGFGQTDLRTDVYAIGMCAFFCLTGRDPVPSDREAGFAAPGVPEAWRRLIARACAFDPSERYASARELGRAIDGIVSGDTPDKAGQAQQIPVRRVSARGVLLWAWRSRNVVVLPVVVLLVAASTANVLDPTTLYRGNPWYNAFGYLVYMNYCFLALGFVAMDKHWLRRHVRLLRKWRPRRVYATLAGIFVALTVALFAFSMVPA